MKSSTFKSRRNTFLSVWLIVGVLFYIVDCLVVTYFAQTHLDLPWVERGIYAGGPVGILLTVVWFAFPVGRLIFKRVKTRPRD
jgi:hypothetical protein